MALAWCGGVYVAMPRDAFAGRWSLALEACCANRLEMASTSREARNVAIEDFQLPSTPLPVQSSEIEKSHIGFYVVVTVVPGFGVCGDPHDPATHGFSPVIHVTLLSQGSLRDFDLSTTKM